MTEIKHGENNKVQENLQEVPLIDQTTANQKHSINDDIDDNQRFLVILDVTICFTVITFLVVACWRGTWQLMNIYYIYFPMWETFIVSTFAHVTFALCQNVFHEVLLDRTEKRFTIKAVHFGLRRFYLFVFYLVGIAQWSSIWTILDTYSRGYTSEILLTTIGIFLLVLIGALTNICTTPMTISIDEKDGTFLFETGYFYKLLYLTILFTGNNQMDNTSNSTGLPKMLFQAPNLSEDNAQFSHPKPFIVEFSGPQPRQFTPTPPSTTPTTKKATTLIYPQLTNYRNRYYPKNIQEILTHIKNESVHRIQKYSRNTEKRHATNPEHTNLYTTDIFQRYKPKDPSEVNLLATGRVRFSPPVWKDFRRFEGQQNNPQPPFIPTVTHGRNPLHKLIPLNSSFDENVPILLTNENQMTNIMNQFVNFRRNAKRPMSITLNLYPMETSYVPRNDSKSLDPIFPQISKKPESKITNYLDRHILNE